VGSRRAGDVDAELQYGVARQLEDRRQIARLSNIVLVHLVIIIAIDGRCF
jgi:hypothetical protein